MLSNELFTKAFAEYNTDRDVSRQTQGFKQTYKDVTLHVVKHLCCKSPNLFALSRSSTLMAMFSSSEWLWNDSEHSFTPGGNYSPASGIEEAKRNYYAMLYSLLILAIVFGNVLVCIAVLRERALQTTTNYLVVSLAVADLLVASLVMPWAVYLEVSTLETIVVHHV